MGNYTIIHDKSGVAVNFYADSYDIKSKRYYFWLGNDKVAEIALEGYSIIYHATEKQINDSKKETLKQVIDELKNDDNVWRTQDGSTSFNLTDGTITVKKSDLKKQDFIQK